MFPAIAALLIQRHLIDFNDFLILAYILIIPVIICLKIRSSDSVSCIHWGPVLAVESTNKTATMIKRRRDPFIHSFHHVTKVKLGRANTGPAYRFPLSFQSWILRSNLKRWKTNMWTNCKSGHLWSTYSTHPSISVTVKTAKFLLELHFANGLHISYRSLPMHCCQGEKVQCCICVSSRWVKHSAVWYNSKLWWVL